MNFTRVNKTYSFLLHQNNAEKKEINESEIWHQKEEIYIYRRKANRILEVLFVERIDKAGNTQM